MRLFRADGPVYEVISKFTDMVLLSLCWLVCSIPIATLGASTAALYAVCFKMLKNEEGHVCRQFFSYFKSNFKQATLAWLILLPIGLIIAYMLYLYYFGMSVMEGAADVFAILLLVAAALYVIALTYVFACAARYENTPVQTVKNGIFIGLKFLGRTVILLAITVAVMFVALWNYTTMFVAVLLVPAFLTYVHGSFIIRIFEKLEEERAERECREENERHKAKSE
ncbi:MAG: YesL family protein [Lachnospiraceae bacterium]|nr:YesL family protein [Ruminococcus sp.]MCM1275425.1 YesL family protein [Lachnospiraceae bacterium]